ncbi:MAG: hypothetical protein SynsKO_29340 [Synoicihabitans sp.]
MNTIQEFLTQQSNIKPAEGQKGEFTDWLSFHELQLAGDALQFTETRVLGLRGNEENECFEIPVSPGSFSVECKGVRFGADSRIAALRCYPSELSVVLGKKVSKIPVDMGGVSVVDIATIHSSMQEDEEEHEEWIEEILYGDDFSPVSIHKWDATNTEIPSVESGFGDGTYNLFELVFEGSVVGLQVEFIGEDDTY